MLKNTAGGEAERLDGGNETFDVTILHNTSDIVHYQELTDDDGHVVPFLLAQGDSSDDDECDDDDENDDDGAVEQGEGTAPRQPPALLLLKEGDAGKEKKGMRTKHRVPTFDLFPRTIAELGRMEPADIIKEGKAFHSADHCLLATKELSVRLQAPRLKVNMRCGPNYDHHYLKCVCTGLAGKCEFLMAAGMKRQRRSTTCSEAEDDLPWVVREYKGHTCLSASSTAAENNDASTKHVSAAALMSLPLRLSVCALTIQSFHLMRMGRCMR